jgi:hypothetical protein
MADLGSWYTAQTEHYGVLVWCGENASVYTPSCAAASAEQANWCAGEGLVPKGTPLVYLRWYVQMSLLTHATAGCAALGATGALNDTLLSREKLLCSLSSGPCWDRQASTGLCR